MFIYFKEVTGVQTWVDHGVNPAVFPLLTATSEVKQGPVFEVYCMFRLKLRTQCMATDGYVEGFLN